MMFFLKAKVSQNAKTYIRCINIQLQYAKMLTPTFYLAFYKNLGLIKH